MADKFVVTTVTLVLYRLGPECAVDTHNSVKLSPTGGPAQIVGWHVFHLSNIRA